MCSVKLIEELNYLGISISYDRVMQIENDIAHSLCGQYQASEVVCPSDLRKGLFVLGVVDNMDHDPSPFLLNLLFVVQVLVSPVSCCLGWIDDAEWLKAHLDDDPRSSKGM